MLWALSEKFALLLACLTFEDMDEILMCGIKPKACSLVVKDLFFVMVSTGKAYM